MIVDPDFLDHWRTRMLVDLLDGDEFAPHYILRLWSHCQARKSDSFSELPPEGLKAICRFKGDAEKFDKAMATTGWIKRDGQTVKALKFAKHNASLFAAWSNGTKGGRPPKDKPTDNPPEPTGNPQATHAEPIREEKIGEEERGEETNTPLPTLPTPTRAAELATQFWFQLPGRRKPPVDEITPEFEELLRIHGEGVADAVLKKILDPGRDKRQKLWQFWVYCGLDATPIQAKKRDPPPVTYDLSEADVLALRTDRDRQAMKDARTA